VIKMGEIKIVVSDETEKVVEQICERLGIKKTEYLKGLLIEELKKGLKK
jgi:diphthamide synthase (EF-2-diphthine--ammonia ligase)